MIETKASACPLDCPDACSLEVTVEDDRVIRMDGSRVNPATEGYICAKVRHFPEHVYSPERLLHPAVRDGAKGEGRFKPVSWDQALDLIASKMLEVRERTGGEAILPFYYGGSNGMLTQDSTDLRLFRRLGASRLLRTVCAVPTGLAATGLYGKMPGVAYPDYLKAKLIVVWGCNPAVTGIHLVPLIQEAQKKGAKLVVVDPRRTRLAERADLHIALRPGTDLPVALSVIRWLFDNGEADLEFLAKHATGVDELRLRAEEWTIERAAGIAGVAPADIEALAKLYAATHPAVVRCGWGLERNRNGGSAVAAVLALPAVAGKFGVRGGGYTLSNSGAWKFLGASVNEPEPPTRAVNMNRLGEILEHRDGRRVDLLFVYNANPLATIPNQVKVRAGLGRKDLFTVVFDQVMTDTALYADVILPATTFLEHSEISRGYGAMVLQAAGPVIAPVGDSRPNYEVFAELCRRTGLSRADDESDVASLTRNVLGNGKGSALTDALAANGVAYPECGPEPVQFADSFPKTPDGKVHLFPPALDAESSHGLYHYRPDPATSEFPLALISPAHDRAVSSSLGQLVRKQVPVEMHPDDAGRRGIRDNDIVRVFNQLGEVRCHARVTLAMRPGVVQIPKGLWSHNTLNGATANALAPDSGTDLGDGACFNDARVEIERLEEGSG